MQKQVFDGLDSKRLLKICISFLKLTSKVRHPLRWKGLQDVMKLLSFVCLVQCCLNVECTACRSHF